MTSEMTTAKPKTTRYRVRRWTAFEWSFHNEEERKQREAHLEDFARKIENRLVDIAPQWEPRAVFVRVEGTPQLMFEVTLEAADEREATKRAMYRIERALTVKLTPDRNPPVETAYLKPRMARRYYQPQARTLDPPWGKVDIDVLG